MQNNTAVLKKRTFIGANTNLERSAHVLRHTCLTNLVRHGNVLVLVVEVKEHKRLETTHRYSLLYLEGSDAAMEELRIDHECGT
jgi:site-specific recombinase XerD